jgi:hypothetical protein
MGNWFNQLFPLKVSGETVNLLISALKQINNPLVAMAVPQLEAGLLKYWRTNNTREPNYVSFTFAPAVSSRFEIPCGRSFRVKNIRLKNESGQVRSTMTIYFSRGLVVGYSIENGPNFDPDISSVDVTDARIEFLDEPDPELKKLINDDIKQLVNWSDVFEVDLEGTTFIHLKDVGDGDFLAVDHSGNGYLIKHDPFEIIHGNLTELLSHSERLT